MPAAAHRPDGWILAYLVEVVFDTNAARTGYDHVGTFARCTGCGERLDLAAPADLARHARRHEWNVDTATAGAGSADPQPRVASLRPEEVSPEHTTD